MNELEIHDTTDRPPHFLLPAPPFSTEVPSNESIATLAAVLADLAAGTGTPPPFVDLATRTLAELCRIRAAGSLANISDLVAREFRLRPGALQSRTREQRIAFARQLAMYLCRKITGKPFPTTGRHFDRDHSTCIHACNLIERRIQRDAAFRLFIEKLEGQITGAVPTTTAAAA